jgi:hypothetical protein
MGWTGLQLNYVGMAFINNNNYLSTMDKMIFLYDLNLNNTGNFY